MKRISLSFLVILFLAVNIHSAERVTTLKGFTLVPPEGWVVLSKDQRGKLLETQRALLEKLHNPDLSSIALMVINPRKQAFADNINVVVSNGGISLDQLEKEYVSSVSEQFAKMGVVPNGLEKPSGSCWAPTRRCPYNMRCSIPGSLEKLRQWVVTIPGRGQTYMVTCTTTAATFDSSLPRSDGAMQYRSRCWTAGLVVYAITNSSLYNFRAVIGGIVGGVCALFRVLRKKLKAPEAAPSG